MCKCCYTLLCSLLLFLCSPFWGPWNSLKHAFQGYWRPYPTDGDYASHPYSLWRGIFMGYVWELACERLGGDPKPLEARSDGTFPYPFELFDKTADKDGRAVMRCHGGHGGAVAPVVAGAAAGAVAPLGAGAAAGAVAPLGAGAAAGAVVAGAAAGAVAPVVAGAAATPGASYNVNGTHDSTVHLASNDSAAERLGITRAILQQAGKETRDRLTSELSVMMTVCTFIGGFVFTTLVNRAPPSSECAQPGSFHVFGLFAGLCFIVAVIAVGLYARVIVLLQWSATTVSLYRVICNWERAMSGNQLMFLLVITFALASALAACWDRYAKGVFGVLVICTVVTWWCFMYFWSKSMWSTQHGVMFNFPALYYKRLLNTEKPFEDPNSCCSNRKFVQVDNIERTFYGMVDGYLRFRAGSCEELLDSMQAQQDILQRDVSQVQKLLQRLQLRQRYCMWWHLLDEMVQQQITERQREVRKLQQAQEQQLWDQVEQLQQLVLQPLQPQWQRTVQQRVDQLEAKLGY